MTNEWKVILTGLSAFWGGVFFLFGGDVITALLMALVAMIFMLAYIKTCKYAINKAHQEMVNFEDEYDPDRN